MRWQAARIAPDRTHHVVDGRPCYELRFDAVMAFHAPGLAPVRAGDLAWHIDDDGRAAYARRFSRTFGFYEGWAAVVSEDGWHHIRPDGTDLAADRYPWCGNFQGGRCAVRELDGRYVHLTADGVPAYTARWRYVGDFRDGSAVVQRDDGLSTHIGENGTPVHGRWLLDLDVFHKGLACARDAGGWMHLDGAGRPTYLRRFARVEPFYNGQARVEQGDGRRLVIDERGETVIELRPVDLGGIVPGDEPIVVLVRHAERPPLPAGTSGDDVALTEAGRHAAHALGAALGRRVTSITTSPVRRCRETATEIAAGAGVAHEIALEPLLGGPGAFVADAELAWVNWTRLGNVGVIEHLAQGRDSLPGMVAPEVAVARLLDLVERHLGASEGLHLFITHDAVLAPFVTRLLASDQVLWPDFLAVALVWREGASMRVWADGRARTVSTTWLGTPKVGE